MRSTNSRITAPTNATMISVMIAWPAIEKWMWSRPARTPPRKAPITPAMMSPNRPRSRPRATLLASAPARRPTRTQMMMVSTSRRMSIIGDQYEHGVLGLSRLGRKLLEHRSEHTVELGNRMDEFGEDALGSFRLERQHKFANFFDRHGDH